jgi:hypothetical protein
MFSTRSFVIPIEDTRVSGTIARLYDKDPIRISFLNFNFSMGKTRYFVEVKYVCPLRNLTTFVKLELLRTKFISLNNGDDITVKFRVCKDYVYGVASPFRYLIPIGIE